MAALEQTCARPPTPQAARVHQIHPTGGASGSNTMVMLFVMVFVFFVQFLTRDLSVVLVACTSLRCYKVSHPGCSIPGVNGERDKYHVFLVEFANDLIAVDEKCVGGGGLVHMSKFSMFMVLKVVVCIGSDSDSVENVSASGWYVLGVGRSLVMLMSAPIVVYGQWWHAVGLGGNETSKGCAVESERRWNNSLTVMGVLGKR